jgi:hypothetical protein
MNCPKCGYQQEKGPECLRCGIVFARYRPETEYPKSETVPGMSAPQKTIGPFRRFYRVFRWVGLAILIIVLFLMLRTSPPPQITANAEATKRAEAKIEEFQSSIGQGFEQRLEMDEAELNGWLSGNLALKKPAGPRPALPQTQDSLIDLAKTATGGRPVSREDLEQVQSSVRDVKIVLLEDALRIYTLFEFHGKDLSLELEGRPVVNDGYIKLEPTSGKLGSLPLMAGTLKSVTDRLFDSPQNKEKFRLPPDIQDIRIEQGQLVIISR